MTKSDRSPPKAAARSPQKEITVNSAASHRNPAAGSFFAFLYDPPKPNDRTIKEGSQPPDAVQEKDRRPGKGKPEDPRKKGPA